MTIWDVMAIVDQEDRVESFVANCFLDCSLELLSQRFFVKHCGLFVLFLSFFVGVGCGVFVFGRIFGNQ